MKKRICALVCAILLCCGLAAAGAEPVQSTLESGENIFVFSLIGDCCIGDNAWSPGTQSGYLNKIKKAGFDYPFSLVADMFAGDDLTVANCECTFTDRLKHRNGIYFPMLAPTSYAEVLKLGNVDVCNLANNHCLRDVGKKGGEETAAALTAQGIG